jgi:hypothetical protein
MVTGLTPTCFAMSSDCIAADTKPESGIFEPESTGHNGPLVYLNSTPKAKYFTASSWLYILDI